MTKDKKPLGVNHSKKKKSSDATLQWCKGKKKPPHKPWWVKDETWSANTWLLKCRSCGMVLGSRRMMDGEPVINVKKFNGYENFLGGPK